MGLDFPRRVRNTSLVVGFILSCAIAVYWDVAAGTGWFLGLSWSLVNLYLIGLIVEAMLSKGPVRRLRIVVILLLKVPVLYAIGFLLLSSGWFPVVSLVAGFVWPLTVILLKVLGRLV
ncbi:MAG: hypothetical protein KAJ37_02080, partial [Candidatus Krumholzibacteria bacterium]|nr:hypothetical protein [Candidatus Krumholzibacteria bacterium]